MDMFMNADNYGFSNIHKNTKSKNSFVGILNSWIDLHMKYTKFNVQQLKMISWKYVYIIFLLNLLELKAGSMYCNNSYFGTVQVNTILKPPEHGLGINMR